MTLTFERIHWIESIEVQALLAGLGILLQSIVVLLPLRWITQAPNPAWVTLKAACAGNLIFTLALAAQSRGLISNYWQFAYGIPTRLRLSLGLAYASLFSLGLSLAFLFFGITETNMTPAAGIMYMLGLLGALCFFAVLRYWNILRFPPFLRR